MQTFEIYLPKKLREILAKARIQAPTDSQLELSVTKRQGKLVAEDDDALADADGNMAGEAVPLAPKGGWSP